MVNFEDDFSQDTICAVSYTHLDVYKRQACRYPDKQYPERNI